MKLHRSDVKTRPWVCTLMTASFLACGCGAGASVPEEGAGTGASTDGDAEGGAGTGASADADAGSRCIPHSMELDGILNGQAVHASYASHQFGSQRHFRFDFGTGGEVNLSGEDLVRDEVNLDADGLIWMPAEGPDAGAWFHGGAGTSMIHVDSDYRFSLDSLTRLGACPGVPIASELYYHNDSILLGTLGEESIEGVAAYGEARSTPDGFNQHAYGSFGVLFLEVHGSEIVNGYLLRREEGMGPRRVYCIGSGSFRAKVDKPAEDFTGGDYVLSDISRLDAPSDAGSAAGTLHGCVGPDDPW